MNIKEKLINALGGQIKTTNGVMNGNEFLKYGPKNRRVLPPDWAELKMSDEDMYKGYTYAVIQKRANKVASLAKENLNTWVKPEVMDLFQKKEADPIHPYLKLIEDSTDFSTKQFWKTICIYLDLAGVFYLAAVRDKIDPKNPLAPSIITDIKKFILLNPYEVKRVVNKDGELAGYLETKKDGRQRQWPIHMIIPMTELNPFNNDKVWSMTDAAKEATFTLNQSGNYTRETLNGNLNAPGIITTDVILEDEQFADFIERVRLHNKGEPLFGNGAGAISWNSMQVDLDRAALTDINEINRSELFAVSGTSKTSLGIEQSGTTRETARVQTEQFISDTAQPRLEDIIDFLNLDYKRYYRKEYDATGYWIEIKSASSRDYATETQATSMRQAQSALAFDLMQKGYTMQSSYDYAEGKIELSDLELEKGMDKPINPDKPDEPDEPETPSTTNVEPSESDEKPEEDKDTTEEVSEEENALKKLEGLEPHAGLKANSLEEEHDHTDCDCGKVEVLINELGEAKGKTLEESYKKFLNDIDKVQKETYKACIRKLTINAFTEDDIITPKKKLELTNQLKAIIQNYWWILTPLFANALMEERNEEFGENAAFVFTNALQEKVENNASRVSEGHMETILDDILTASNKAYTDIMENKAAELIVKAYRDDNPKYVKYFEEQPTMKEALKAIRNTDILEENRKIYERANELAVQGYKREDIIKAIRNEYDKLSETRATLIAKNETSRAYGHSQYEADTQFLNSIGQLETAYKRLVSRRPESEKDKICPICQSIIDMGPIPFTQNFISLGETITAERDGKVYNYVCNYEDIESSTIHPNCMCHYELILNGKTLNEINPSGGDDNMGPSDAPDVSNSFSGQRIENGGKGSGNFGHAGRIGEVGGSAPKEGEKFDYDRAETLDVESIEKWAYEGSWSDYKKKLEAKYAERYPDYQIKIKRVRDPYGGKGIQSYIVYGIKKDSVSSKVNADDSDLKKLEVINGGKGSGNFGHVGREGKVGGSGKGKGISAREQFNKLKEITNWTRNELDYAIPYFGSFENTTKVQEYLRGGDDGALTPYVTASDCARTMKKKMAETTLPEDITLYRGMMIRNDRMERVEQNGFSYPGFQSTTLMGNDASRIVQEYRDSGNYDKQYYTPVLLKINAKKGAHFASSYTDAEHEIVLPDNIEFKIKNKKPTSWGAVIYEVDYE